VSGGIVCVCMYGARQGDDGDNRDSGVGDGAFQGQWDMARWDEVKVQGRRPGVCGWSVGGDGGARKRVAVMEALALAQAGGSGQWAVGSGQDLHCWARERSGEGREWCRCGVGWEGRAVVGNKLP